MALILKLLGTHGIDDRRVDGVEDDSLECTNPHCLTGVERGIKKLFKNGKCIYCDQTATKK
jgi:aspartate carbamoyltransferase regulatory subunit